MKIQEKFKSSKGFTIVELIMYMAIFSILLVITVQMLTSIFDIHSESSATSAVSQDGRFILNRFAYDILRSDSTLVSNPTTLVLTQEGISKTYTLSSGNINLIDSGLGSTDRLNSYGTSVTSLTFTQIGSASGSSTIRLNFTLESDVVRTGGRKEIKSFQTTVGTR